MWMIPCVLWWICAKCLSKNCPFETPTFPNVEVRDISGLIHSRFFLRSSPRTQSSQKAWNQKFLWDCLGFSNLLLAIVGTIHLSKYSFSTSNRVHQRSQFDEANVDSVQFDHLYHCHSTRKYNKGFLLDLVANRK